MMKFEKDSFNWDGMYLTYGTDRKFVARFKYRGGDRVAFTNFLIKNFTVEEYFTQYEETHSPLKVLEAKGYVSGNVKKLLKQFGYPQTIDGKKQYLADQCSKYTDRIAAIQEQGEKQ